MAKTAIKPQVHQWTFPDGHAVLEQYAEQAAYLGVEVEGPYKAEHYRY